MHPPFAFAVNSEAARIAVGEDLRACQATLLSRARSESRFRPAVPAVLGGACCRMLLARSTGRWTKTTVL
jgi:hypothetical protein